MRPLTNTFAMFVAMLALTLMFLLSSGVALGQEGNTGSNPGYSGGPGAINPGTIDDATLKQTARAYVRVRQIVQKAQQAFNSASDAAQKQQIAEQVESGKMAAVKAEGLKPQQYNHRSYSLPRPIRLFSRSSCPTSTR